jgi:hypothetical protein
MEAINRADLDAVGVFALDAFFGYYKSHPSFSSDSVRFSGLVIIRLW